LKLKAGTKQEKADSVTKDEEDDNDDDPDPHPGNKGKLQLNATVCDADIKYPTDLDLLNESRQKAEELIDELCLKVKYFFVIRHLLEQQESMYKKKSHQVEDRIVSIHQPHVRPIVCGKAKAKTEFGAKINISLLDGYARVDHFDWDAFNEGQDLQAQVERFRELTGKYPELVQVDKIYLTRENRRFLKEKRIRYTGEPLGRKPVKEIKSRYQKRKERREAVERNQVEGKFGQGKRGYGLNDIRARLATTSNSWIGAIIFVMNLIRYMRDIPLSYFVSLLLKLMKVRNINIYPVKPQMKLCA